MTAYCGFCVCFSFFSTGSLLITGLQDILDWTPQPWTQPHPPPSQEKRRPQEEVKDGLDDGQIRIGVARHSQWLQRAQVSVVGIEPGHLPKFSTCKAKKRN